MTCPEAFSPNVVPANAGTHNPWRSRLQNLRRNTVLESKVLGAAMSALALTLGSPRPVRNCALGGDDV